MYKFYYAKSQMHLSLLKAMQSKDAVSIDNDYGTGDWYTFHTKLSTLLGLTDEQGQESLHRFWMETLPNGAYASPSHEFWGSQAALDVEEILDGLLDAYTPVGWVYGKFTNGEDWVGNAVVEYGWFKPCVTLHSEPRTRNVAYVELSNRSVA